MQKRDVAHAKFFGKLTIMQLMTIVGGSALIITLMLRPYLM
jgi:hypothetical protein